MRRTLSSLVAAALIVAPGLAAAQQSGGSQPAAAAQADVNLENANFFDVIARGTSFKSGSDEARFERYRDLRNGGTLDKFRFTDDNQSRKWSVQADHVGYRDQRYSASYNNFGKLKVSFEWNQIPIFFSDSTSTLFTTNGSQLLLPDSIQSGLQNKTLTPTQAVLQAQPLDLRYRRDVMDLKLTYSATPSLDLSLWLRHNHKTGNQLWEGTFGLSDAVELPVPVDTRQTELDASLEWTRDRGVIRVGYDGSFFRNANQVLTWDNPLRITDSPTLGPMQGREALWPDNNVNSFNATGLYKLPWWRSQATAYLSVGNWSQNQQLIPFTINSALAPIPLDRTNADAKAVVTAMNYQFTAKPTDQLWLNARFRSYDYDNRTPIFEVTNRVAYDTAVQVGEATSPYSFTRRNFDADASYSPIAFTALRIGYSREQVDQAFRTFDKTVENTLRLSADTTGLPWLTLRGVYEHGKRTGSGLDQTTLDDIGEQVSLRQFDISDRITDRFSAIAMVTPFSSLSFNGTVGVGNEDRTASYFGLRSNKNHTASVGVDYVPNKKVSAGLSYEYEKYSTDQRSRQANPGVQFNDPARDWTDDAEDNAHTVAGSFDLLKLWPKTDIRFGYNFSRANSTYVYNLASNFLAPQSLIQLPQVRNEFQRGTADVRYYINQHVSAGFAYWFDKYAVNDYAFGQQTLTTLAQPSFLMIGYLYRPYTANTFIGRLTYLW